MSAAVPVISLEDLAAAIPDGALLGVPADYSGVPMAATRALIARRAKNLRLFCLPISTIQADMLIGAGCVATIEAAAVTLGEHGLAPRFCKAVEEGTVTMRDSTCPALHTQLQATAKGVPYMPLRGILETDILKHRPDWRVEQNPFVNAADPIVLLPAIKLDVALFHAPAADRNGNIWIGRCREVATLAEAAAKVLVTVEKVLDEDFFATEERASGALAGFYLDAMALAPNGAWPCALQGVYEADEAAIGAYAKAARSDDGFAACIGRRPG